MSDLEIESLVTGIYCPILYERLRYGYHPYPKQKHTVYSTVIQFYTP
jgi:hypothetical protein